MENSYIKNLSVSKRIKLCCVVSVDFTLKFMLFNQLKFLQSQGYDVYAVCSPGMWVQDIEKEGIKVKTIKIPRKMTISLSDLVAFIKLFLYFKKEKFDIVHVHTPKAEIYGQIAAKLAGVPVIANTLHGFGLDLPREVPYWKKKLFMLLQKIAGKFASVVFSISYDIIKKTKKHKVFSPDLLLYLGRDIDTERFDPRRFDDEFIKRKKKELNISDNKKVIGIVARLVVEKGFLELFEAFKNILKLFPEALLLVVGPEEPEKKDGITKENAKDYGIEKNVMFLGDRSDVEEIYPIMDVFILPSHREGLGAVILEASAMEIPVVATNIGGCPEAVDDRKTGILVGVKNPNEITNALMHLLNNPEEAKKMGQMGREKVIREFGKNIVFERLGSEYKRLIKEKLNMDLEYEWLLKYKQAAKENKKEYEIMFHSETGFRNDNLYFFDYFERHIENKEHNLDKKILDVGCGFGDSLRPLAKLGFKCYGVDYVSEIVEMAKNKDRNIEFQVADVYNLPYKDNFFDIVICKGVFQVLSDPEKAIGELKRVLNKNGILIIITLNIFALDILFQNSKVIRYNPYKFKKLMKENGFDDFKLKGVYVMPSFLGFMADIIVKFKIHHLLNFFYPFFTVFSHNFYIESRKK